MIAPVIARSLPAVLIARRRKRTHSAERRLCRAQDLADRDPYDHLTCHPDRIETESTHLQTVRSTWRETATTSASFLLPAKGRLSGESRRQIDTQLPFAGFMGGRGLEWGDVAHHNAPEAGLAKTSPVLGEAAIGLMRRRKECG